jgi:hypothetical protein
MSTIISGDSITFNDSTVQYTNVPNPGSTGNVLTSNGTTWNSAPQFASGTRWFFVQTTAPTGWTKDTTNYNNNTLRVTTSTASTGGSVDFTSAFVSQAVSGTINSSGLTFNSFTLTTAEMPSHTHVYTDMSQGPGPTSAGGGSNSYNTASGNTVAEGGGTSHTHAASGSLTFTGTAINLAVKYVDAITATKD